MYYRQFITLSGDGKGLGRVVLEARDDRARAMVYLQDIKEGSYRLLLLSKGDGENFAVDLGTVVVCDRNRFEGTFELNRTNIANSGLTLECIDGAAAILPKMPGEFKPRNGFDMILAGFCGAPYSWRANLSFPQHSVEAVVDVVEKVAEIPKIQAAEAAPPVIPAKAGIPPESNERLDKYFNPANIVDVFNDEEPQAEWVTASLFDLHSLGLYNYSIQNNPAIITNARKFRHVLLGRTNSGGQRGYVLGIPDILPKKDIHAMESAMGTFRPCHPQGPSEEMHGYWLMHL
ncbi:MAG: hypothetical protein LBE35_06125 [Clostridiales bacterium]|jgi:hypothetical protein|nr:hypothetical protein [Clostridiales bacterium]